MAAYRGAVSRGGKPRCTLGFDLMISRITKISNFIHNGYRLTSPGFLVIASALAFRTVTNGSPPLTPRDTPVSLKIPVNVAKRPLSWGGRGASAQRPIARTAARRPFPPAAPYPPSPPPPQTPHDYNTPPTTNRRQAQPRWPRSPVARWRDLLTESNSDEIRRDTTTSDEIRRDPTRFGARRLPFRY